MADDNSTLMLIGGGLLLWWWLNNRTTADVAAVAGTAVTGTSVTPGVIIASPLDKIPPAAPPVYACPAGYVFDGNQCVRQGPEFLGPPVRDCGAGYVWNGKQCIPTQSDPVYYYAQGGVCGPGNWTQTCHMAEPPRRILGFE